MKVIFCTISIYLNHKKKKKQINSYFQIFELKLQNKTFKKKYTSFTFAIISQYNNKDISDI